MQNTKRRNLILLSAVLLFIASTACSSADFTIANFLRIIKSYSEAAEADKGDDQAWATAFKAQTQAAALATSYVGTADAQTIEAFGTSYVGTADAQTATAQAAKLPAEEQPAEGIQPATATVTQTGAPLSDDLSCTMTVLVNLFCRPAPGYAPSDSFTPGLSAEVVGYSSDRLYTFVIGPKGRVCTVPTDPKLVELTGGGCERLPQYTLLPPPTLTSTATLTPSPTIYPTYTPTVLMPSATATISPTP